MTTLSTSLRQFFDMDFEAAAEYIHHQFTSELFDKFLSQKGFEKVYKNIKLTQQQKEMLIQAMQDALPDRRSDIENTNLFVRLLLPIAEQLALEIGTIIKENFGNSMSLFYYCIGCYVSEHPQSISRAKSALISIASKCLENDTASVSYHLSFSLYNSYIKKKSILHTLFQKAMKYGAIMEKYDAISFCVEQVVRIDIIYGKPQVHLRLRDPRYNYGIQCGALFHHWISNQRLKEAPGIIESHYQCTICKESQIMLYSEENTDAARYCLRKQYASRTQTDLFYFFTGDFQSYILSMITYIYVRLLLLFFCKHNTMEMLTPIDIQRGMMWGEVIGTNRFTEYYELIITDPTFHKHFEVVDENVIIGKWQFDLELNIIELSKRIALNAKNSHTAGIYSNNFGKNVYETITRSILAENGWAVVPQSIKIKSNGCILTDIDLLAYSQEIVLLGQIKLANTGREPYDIWKSYQTVGKAISQIKNALIYAKQDKNLVYSAMKRFGININKKQIKKIVPIVITSSNYYLGAYEDEKVPIVSLDMFTQIIESLHHYKEVHTIEEYLQNLFSLYDFPLPSDPQISIIDQNEYKLIYEEIAE